jgi:hypothetical protein
LERKAEKKKKKKQKEEELPEKDFTNLKDEVKFGEVVQQPPRLEIRPKLKLKSLMNNQVSTSSSSNSSSIQETSTSSSQNKSNNSTTQVNQALRLRVMENYAQLKRQRRLQSMREKLRNKQ